jgi:hypothetical protein
MARRFRDVAPVQLERLIHTDTLAERAPGGNARAQSSRVLYPCGRARIREANGQAVLRVTGTGPRISDDRDIGQRSTLAHLCVVAQEGDDAGKFSIVEVENVQPKTSVMLDAI